MSVKFGLLALLATEPMYGAQLRSEFEARTGGTWPLNVGQVYTTLTRLERDGLLVRGVVKDSPAERAGLARGDLIVRAGDREPATIDDLFDALDAAAGGTLALGIVRGSDERSVDVVLD